MLKELLAQKQCFKLICGAGNQNLEEISRLVAVYSKAGCRFFDFAADEKVLQAAQRGLDFSVPKEEQKDYHFCISIGTKNDPHFKKAKIEPNKCKKCEKCVKICPQNAITSYFKVVKEKCIGCSICLQACKHGAIKIYQQNKTFTLSTLQLFDISCVELHVSDKEPALAMWEELCDNFYPMLSICIGQNVFPKAETIDLLAKMVAKRPPYTVIIQADGIPMSGSDDELETTRPAVEMGKMIKSLNLPIFLLLSGGTNSKTAQLAKCEGVEINGVAMGSYARKSVQDFINCNDFWTNIDAQNEAVKIAKTLINSH